ncbi:rhomboid family intramembrane serine protease [Asticcacaulis machinosus]|uniref:Rhomboid family intramembrane serine protease n=1 Tax=Asticcacaulis machinosus TaxID=2984211 RepID=A0ABT5HNE4_9CAUL|nr:rhomboid family intramembrane serine protease [Asticcacaulis machinosus]MDC7677766.1 rhomboid family intramembrane serine protease [Asticcacaulis machinosus]
MPDTSRRHHEPAFNAPWPALLLCVFILGLYGLQSMVSDEQLLFINFGLSPILLSQGHWSSLITSLFLHGNWLHAGINAVMALAFAAPVARAFGLGFRGFLSFLAFYLVCGMAAGLGYCLIHMNQDVILVGASGAVSGLMGAAMRLRIEGLLLPILSKPVIGASVVWIGINLFAGFFTFMPGVEAGSIAWEAHVFGYLFGLLLIGAWLGAFHRKRLKVLQ